MRGNAFYLTKFQISFLFVCVWVNGLLNLTTDKHADLEKVMGSQLFY